MKGQQQGGRPTPKGEGKNAGKACLFYASLSLSRACRAAAPRRR
jgi:hypothetical protein